MSNAVTPEQMAETEQARAEWVRTQFQKANEYLASKGILPDNVAVKDSRYLPPFVAVWKLNTKDRHSFWVMTGDLPTDHLPLSAAASAHEAIRAFSLHWQLKAQQIIDAGIADKTQEDFVNLLVSRAHSLYAMFEDEQLWKNVEQD